MSQNDIINQSKKQFFPRQVSGDLKLRSGGTCVSLNQPIRSTDGARAWNLLPWEGGSKHRVQHAQNFQQVSLVVNFSLQQLLQADHLTVDDCRLAEHGLIDVQDYFSHCYEDGRKPGIKHVSERKRIYLMKLFNTSKQIFKTL